MNNLKINKKIQTANMFMPDLISHVLKDRAKYEVRTQANLFADCSPG